MVCTFSSCTLNNFRYQIATQCHFLWQTKIGVSSRPCTQTSTMLSVCCALCSVVGPQLGHNNCHAVNEKAQCLNGALACRYRGYLCCAQMHVNCVCLGWDTGLNYTFLVWCNRHHVNTHAHFRCSCVGMALPPVKLNTNPYAQRNGKHWFTETRGAIKEHFDIDLPTFTLMSCIVRGKTQLCVVHFTLQQPLEAKGRSIPKTFAITTVNVKHAIFIRPLDCRSHAQQSKT